MSMNITLFQNVIPLLRKNFQILSISRNYAAPKRKPKVDKKIQAQAESLSARGFLRSYKPYAPPSNVEEKISQICLQNNLKFDENEIISDLKEKCCLLRQCCLEFNHAVPNSKLHSLETIGDVIKFYNTPIETTTPYEALKKMDLPKNLHVQYEYKRFHPDTDTLFKGVSAFPKSSTLVTGLKYKKKYEGYAAKRSWP